MSKRKNRKARENSRKKMKISLIEKAIRKRFKREIPEFFKKIQNEIVIARCPSCAYMSPFSRIENKVEKLDDILWRFGNRVGCGGCGRLFNGFEESEIEGRVPTLIFLPRAYLTEASGAIF
jgi:hypothetical protein